MPSIFGGARKRRSRSAAKKAGAPKRKSVAGRKRRSRRSSRKSVKRSGSRRKPAAKGRKRRSRARKWIL